MEIQNKKVLSSFQFFAECVDIFWGTAYKVKFKSFALIFVLEKLIQLKRDPKSNRMFIYHNDYNIVIPMWS